MKGLVLAAGLGKRLRPITDTLPKPLIPFGGFAPLHLALAKARAAGIETLAVNTHHLPEAIRGALLGNPLGQGVQISHEPVLMDTGGVFVGLRDWAGHDDVLIHNGDIVSTVDLARIIAAHEGAKARGVVATMVTLDHVVTGTNPLWCVGDRLARIGGLRAGDPQPEGSAGRTFTGIHVVSSELRCFIPNSGPSSIIAAYDEALRRGMAIQVISHYGGWFDLGTPRSYLEANLALLDHVDDGVSLNAYGIREASERLYRPVLVIDEHSTKTVGDLTIHGPCIVAGQPPPSGSGSIGPRCVVHDGPHLTDLAITESVLGPSTRLAEMRGHATRQIVNADYRCDLS